MLGDLFLAVICVIMVKNTVTRLIFRRKSGETAPQCGAKLSKRTQRSGSLTVSEKVDSFESTFLFYFFFLKICARNKITSITRKKANRMPRVSTGFLGARVASSIRGKPKTMAGKF